MSNSSDEFWSVNGVSLHQWGWSVTTVGGSRYDLPTRRGENIETVYRPGGYHRNKTLDQRVVNLIMWMQGIDPATGENSGDLTLQWNDNWDYLRRLVFQWDGSQVDLTRRWRLTDKDGHPRLLSATAKAELTNAMDPAMMGRHRSDFTMEFLLAEPYFYGDDEVVVEIPMGGSATVYNDGHDVAMYSHLSIEFNGTVSNPRLTNTITNPNIYVEYKGTIQSGQTLHLDVGSYIAWKSPQVVIGALQHEVGKISYSGSRHWFGIVPRYNTLTFTGTGSGSAVVRFRPPYV